MKVGANGLKINAGLVTMQHKSNMVSQLLGGGNSIASMSSLMGGGTARTQAMAMTRQMDTFERLANLDSGKTYSAGSVKGTAREQAKALMKEYEESAELGETAESAEKTEASAAAKK